MSVTPLPAITAALPASPAAPASPKAANADHAPARPFAHLLDRAHGQQGAAKTDPGTDRGPGRSADALAATDADHGAEGGRNAALRLARAAHAQGSGGAPPEMPADGGKDPLPVAKDAEASAGGTDAPPSQATHKASAGDADNAQPTWLAGMGVVAQAAAAPASPEAGGNAVASATAPGRPLRATGDASEAATIAAGTATHPARDAASTTAPGATVEGNANATARGTAPRAARDGRGAATAAAGAAADPASRSGGAAADAAAVGAVAAGNAGMSTAIADSRASAASAGAPPDAGAAGSAAAAAALALQGGAGAAPPAPATGRLAASPGSPDFASQLGAQITTFVRAGVQHARLELNPAEMGPLTVQIQLDGQTAQVHLAAAHAQTRSALEQAMPQLAGTLREAGLTLAGGGVFEQPRQPQPEGGAQARGAGNATGRAAADHGADTRSVVGAAAPAIRRRGVVDLVA